MREESFSFTDHQDISALLDRVRRNHGEFAAYPPPKLQRIFGQPFERLRRGRSNHKSRLEQIVQPTPLSGCAMDIRLNKQRSRQFRTRSNQAVMEIRNEFLPNCLGGTGPQFLAKMFITFLRGLEIEFADELTECLGGRRWLISQHHPPWLPTR
jgi:hypothetical protein